MIGIGPLVTIPLVIAALGGPLALVGWIAGALVALCDGMVWAELSSRFPGSGGTYVYLRAAFGAKTLGRALAFLFNWQFLLYAPCLLASGYIGFANYAAYLFPPPGRTPLVHDAIAVGVGVATDRALYRRTSQRRVARHVARRRGRLDARCWSRLPALTHAHFGQAFHLDAPVRFDAGLLAGFGSALYITLYDYVGYADAALLGDEVVRPQRTIPLAILISVRSSRRSTCCCRSACSASSRGVRCSTATERRPRKRSTSARSSSSEPGDATAADRRDGARSGDGIRVAVRKFAGVFAHSVCGGARRRISSGVRASCIRARTFRTSRCWRSAALSLVASLFTLDQVIAFLTAGIVLIQAVAQIVALGAAARARAGGAVSHAALSAARRRRARGMDSRFRLYRRDRHSARRRVAGDWQRSSSFRRARAALVAVCSARSRCLMRLPAPARADAPRTWATWNVVHGRYRRGLSGIHGRRKAVFPLRCRLLLRTNSARTLARVAARLPAARRSTRSTCTSCGTGMQPVRSRARFHRRDGSAPRSARRLAARPCSSDSR